MRIYSLIGNDEKLSPKENKKQGDHKPPHAPYNDG
jgi:hypothetical protein